MGFGEVHADGRHILARIMPATMLLGALSPSGLLVLGAESKLW